VVSFSKYTPIVFSYSRLPEKLDITTPLGLSTIFSTLLRQPTRIQEGDACGVQLFDKDENEKPWVRHQILSLGSSVTGN